VDCVAIEAVSRGELANLGLNFVLERFEAGEFGVAGGKALQKVDHQGAD
jgi:hypothetical protein